MYISVDQYYSVFWFRILVRITLSTKRLPSKGRTVYVGHFCTKLSNGRLVTGLLTGGGSETRRTE
jgi:hypothetical protein